MFRLVCLTFGCDAALIGRWSVCCCQTGQQTLRLVITAAGEPSSTCLRRSPMSCRKRAWLPHQQEGLTRETAPAATEGGAGGWPKSSRATWTLCGFWTHQQRGWRTQRGPRRSRGACRGSRLWAAWTPDCIAGAIEPRSSTAPPLGTRGRWEGERNCPGVLSEPDLCPTCLVEAKPAE